MAILDKVLRRNRRGDDHQSNGPGVEAPPAMRELGAMVEFALGNPDKSQVPLVRRKDISQSEWEDMTHEEQCRIRDSVGKPHAMPE